VNGKVAAHAGAGASALACAYLANDNLTSFNGLAAKKFDAEALALAIASIFAGTASFHM
jgi:hypothetical protein